MADSTVGGLERLLEDLVRRAVRDSLSSLEQQIRRQVQEAMAQAGPALRDGGQSGGAAGSGATSASASTSSATLVSSLPLMNRAVSRILQPTGQSEIMAAVLQSAAGFAGRCALFVRRGDGFGYWRGEGFPAETASRLKTLSVPSSGGGAFKEVSENLLGVSSVRTAGALPEPLLEALSGAAEETLFLFPVVVQGRAVAVLYADSGVKAGSVEPSALEILARITGLSLETAGSRAAASAAHPVVSPAEAPAPAPAAAATPTAPEPVVFTPAIPPPPDPDTLPEADRDIHKKAYRSARVAVQDLLAYPQNQERIAEGRKNKTLYRLLKEEIDKNRETYQKRFGQTPARAFDYLHYELVIKLAENNPELLGHDYPGEVAG